jgi:small-conductance mechanosensitive channel
MQLTDKTIGYLLFIGITYGIVILLAFVIRKALSIMIRKNSQLIGEDPTKYVFLKNSITLLLFTIATFWILHKIPYFHSLGSALFASAGILAAVIGFASQKAFSNIVGGLFILIFKPFRVGDIIEIADNKKGMVEEITLRHVVIKDYESRRVVIPNSVISEETIINSNITDQKIRKHITFGISYDSNVDLAMEIIQRQVENHPLFIDNRTLEEIKNKEPKVLIRMVSWDDSSVTLKAYVWANNNDDAFTIQCDLLQSVKTEFEQSNIEIPFPHRTIVNKEYSRKDK